MIPIYGRGQGLRVIFEKVFPIFSESTDPRKKDLPPRPSGQRPEPDRRGGGAFGQQFPFGGGNFQFSFGIGGFPFGLFTFGNFGGAPVAGGGGAGEQAPVSCF